MTDFDVHYSSYIHCQIVRLIIYPYTWRHHIIIYSYDKIEIIIFIICLGLKLGSILISNFLFLGGSVDNLRRCNSLRKEEKKERQPGSVRSNSCLVQSNLFHIGPVQPIPYRSVSAWFSVVLFQPGFRLCAAIALPVLCISGGNQRLRYVTNVRF